MMGFVISVLLYHDNPNTASCATGAKCVLFPCHMQPDTLQCLQLSPAETPSQGCKRLRLAAQQEDEKGHMPHAAQKNKAVEDCWQGASA